MTEAVKTGTDVIREVLTARNKKLNLAGFVQEMGIAPSAMDDFMAGRSTPPAAVLQKMARYLWQNAVFDPERNVLISPDVRPDKPFATITPERWDGPKRDWSTIKTEGPTEVSPKKSKPSWGRFTRPGWLS